jgi:glycosyltransferase involved in cell wall biosynthesis
MVVATCGRAVSQKGVDFFLDVVQAWSQREPTEAARAVAWQWLGGGTPEAEERLRQAGVQVSGWLGQQDVVHRLRGVDVYLHTAEWEAGYPLALMEAAALELPLVVRCIPALEDLPLPLVTTPQQAAEQVEALLDPRRRSEASLRTRKVADGWHADHDHGMLSALYRQVAEHGLVGASR